MERPDDIPEDVWGTAVECADVVEHAYWPGVKAIARSILAERVRDAEEGAPMRKKFREWYQERYNCPFPGEQGEMYATVMQRMCDGMAEWADMIAEEAAPSPSQTPSQRSDKE